MSWLMVKENLLDDVEGQPYSFESSRIIAMTVYQNRYGVVAEGVGRFHIKVVVEGMKTLLTVYVGEFFTAEECVFALEELTRALAIFPIVVAEDYFKEMRKGSVWRKLFGSREESSSE